MKLNMVLQLDQRHLIHHFLFHLLNCLTELSERELSERGVSQDLLGDFFSGKVSHVRLGKKYVLQH